MNLRPLVIPAFAGILRLAAQSGVANPMAVGGNAANYDMAPETQPEVVSAAVAAIPSPIPPGPVQPNWDSIKANYHVPQWFVDAKFGIFMHWGPSPSSRHR